MKEFFFYFYQFCIGISMYLYTNNILNLLDIIKISFNNKNQYFYILIILKH